MQTATVTPTPPLDDPSLYFNRELSWIEFNARVLAEAMDSTNLLFDRLKFLGIVSSNFDEFFMVIVGKTPLYQIGAATTSTKLPPYPALCARW